MFDREKMEQFRKDFEEISEVLQKMYNMKLSLGAIRFDSKNFKASISAIALEDAPESVKAEEQVVASPISGVDAYIAKKAEQAGFAIEISPKGFVGSIYRWPSKRFPHTITGVKVDDGRKNIIEMTASSGTKYIAPIDFFRSAVLVGHI